MAPLVEERRQIRAVDRVRSAAVADVDALVATANLEAASSIRPLVMDGVMPLAGSYALAAGALAADWYDAERAAAGVRGGLRALVAEPPDDARYESLAGWIAAMYTTREGGEVVAPDVRGLLSGAVQRIVSDGHRGTISGSSIADPQARGWAIFASGKETCDFCLMLIERGGVYTRATSTFAAHDSCHCHAGPVWAGAESKVDEYKRSARRRPGDENSASRIRERERVQAWIDANL